MRQFAMALLGVLLFAGTAAAHGGISFGINLGFPLFYPVVYPQVYRSYAPPEVVYYESYPARRMVERVYQNGYLLERRVRVIDDGYRYDRYRHGRGYGYYR